MPAAKPESTQSPIQAFFCLFEDEFSIDWITALTGFKPSQVLSAIDSAMRERWLRQGDIGWFFVSDLKKKEQMQSVITPSEKKYYFEKIAQFFLKEISENRLDVIKPAKFLLKLKNEETGCRGLLAAGNAFAKSYQPDKALACYDKLKSDLLTLIGESADVLFIDMAIQTSKVSTARQSTTEVVKTLEAALDRALKRKDGKSEALIRMHIAKNEWLLNRCDRAMKMFQEGWVLANRFDDEKLIRSAMALRMYFSFWQGRFNEVINYYESAVSEVEKNPEKGFPLLAKITVGQCYTYTGQITQGLGMLDAIHQSCRKDGDMHTAAFAMGTINSAFILVKPVDEVLKLLGETYSDIQASGNQYIDILTEGAMSYLCYQAADISRSVLYLKQFVQKCRSVNIDILHHQPYLLEILWAMEQGCYPEMMDLKLEKEVKKLLSGQNVFLKGLAYRYRALLELKAGHSGEAAMRSLAASLRWLELSGHEVEIMLTRFEMYRRYRMAGKQEKARSVIIPCAGSIAKYHNDLIPPALKKIFQETPSNDYFIKEILRFGREVMTISDGRGLIQKILSDVNRLTGAERGAVFMVKDDGPPPELLLQASKNLSHEDVARSEFQSAIDSMQRVVRDPANRDNYIGRQMATGRTSTAITNGAIRSHICVPIIYHGNLKGVLYHDNRLLGSAFKPWDTDLVSFYAGQAAMVLDNMALQEAIRQLNEKMLEDQQYEKARYYPAGQFGGIIGKSDAIRQMLVLIEKVAGTDLNVLILGETGVGKELVANAIHHHSARRTKPFIKANCSALTDTLINSELFGHERGAFTGAESRRRGRFELADKGTLFMDEIGDLPLCSQANLLRTLQNREFERVGGNATLRSDFRLIAATNRDLDEMVNAHLFRADLFFRLNVFLIEVPPLRKRKEDIPLLVHHFIRKCCLKLNKEIKKVPSKEMRKLIQHDWPGNVRELENVIQRSIVLNSSAAIKVLEPSPPRESPEIKKHARTLRQVERDHILWALEEKGWKIRGPNGVAEFLDIHPSTLTARMKKLNISRPKKKI